MQNSIYEMIFINNKDKINKLNQKQEISLGIKLLILLMKEEYVITSPPA